METLLQLDERLFLILNSIHNEFWDVVMVFITARESWYPLYLGIIAFIFYRQGWKQGAVSILLILVAVGLANTITSEVMKPFFERLRPCNDPSLSNKVHLPGICNGGFSFASSHASNSFALAGMSWYVLKKYRFLVVFLVLWATIVSYSRVYVGVHFPTDVLVGSAIGWSVAILLSKLFFKWQP